MNVDPESVGPRRGIEIASHFQKRARPFGRLAVFLTIAALPLVPVGARGAESDKPTFDIVAESGRFNPSELSVPANTAFVVRVRNAEKAAIEFESFELHRERAVQPGETITVIMPSLSAGTYKFFDDFHSDTPQGTITVK